MRKCLRIMLALLLMSMLTLVFSVTRTSLGLKRGKGFAFNNGSRFLMLVVATLIIMSTSLLPAHTNADSANNIAPSYNEASASYSSSSEISAGSHISEPLGSNKPAFLFFYAESCHFCQDQKPIIDELEQQYAEPIAFIRINSEDDPEAMKEFGVTGFPTMFLISDKSADGEYIYQEFRGFTDKQTLRESFDGVITNGSISQLSDIDSDGIADRSQMVLAATDSNGDGIAAEQAGSDPIYQCNSCANCTTCLTGGDCDPVAAGVQAIAPGDTLFLTANIGPGAIPADPLNAFGNCINWNAAASGGGAVGTEITLDCDNFHIIGNAILEAPDAGIYMDNVDWAIIKNCHVHHFGFIGIDLENGSDWNDILDNEVFSNFDDGIGALTGGHNWFFNNDVYDNHHEGIDLYCSSDNDVIMNTVHDNHMSGIAIGCTVLPRCRPTGNEVRDNTVNNNGLDVTADYRDGVLLVHTNENDVTWNTITNNRGNGVHLDDDSNSNRINDNPAIDSNGLDGIRLESSNGNFIERNTIAHNSEHGIYLITSNDNNIQDNNNIEWNTVDGIKLAYSTWNTIFTNLIVDNVRHGVHFFRSQVNDIQSNDIILNGGYGVYDHPYQPVGAPCGQLPGHLLGNNILAGNTGRCNPAPAIPWQDPHLMHDQWCLDTLPKQVGCPVFPNWYAMMAAVVAAGGLGYLTSRRLLKRA